MFQVLGRTIMTTVLGTIIGFVSLLAGVILFILAIIAMINSIITGKDYSKSLTDIYESFLNIKDENDSKVTEDSKDDSKVTEDSKDDSKIEKPKSIAEVMKLLDEILAVKNKSLVERYSMFPITDNYSFKAYKSQQVCSWTANNLEFTKDITHYDQLSTDERHIIDSILAFFLIGDGIISKNLAFRFILESETYESNAFFIEQLRMELIHAESYGLMVQTFIRDPAKMKQLLSIASDSKYMKLKTDFMEKYFYANTDIRERYLAFACAEGIFFCALFGFIFWFRSRGLLHSFVHANEYIARDESLHRDFACGLHKRLGGMDVSKVISIVNEAVEIENQFVDFLIPEDAKLKELSREEMTKYVHQMADNLLVEAGYDTHYNVICSYGWTKERGDIRNNFYETESAGYNEGSLADVIDIHKRTTKTEEIDIHSVDF